MLRIIILAASVALSSLAPAEALAEDKGITLAPKLVLSVPSSKLGTTPAGALEVGYNLPYLGGLLSVALELGYSQPIYTGHASSTAVGGDYAYRIRQRIFSTSVAVLASRNVAMVRPYGGVAYGLYYLNAKAKTLGVAVTETQWRAGLELRGGVGYALGSGEIFGEVAYRYVGLDFESTGESNAAGIQLGVGYRFKF